MKPAEIREVYIECCKLRRREAERGEAEQWVKEFAFFDAADVLAGLESWGRDSTPTGNGQPRGKFWPQPVELKPHVQAAQRQRYARTSSARDLIVWECPSCGCRLSGWPNDPSAPQFCRNWRSAEAPRDSRNWREKSGRCGARMLVDYRERASEVVA